MAPVAESQVGRPAADSLEQPRPLLPRAAASGSSERNLMSHFNALALRPRTTRALAIALAVLTWAVLAIVMAQPASAISSKKADAKAMKILKTKSKKEVVLFRDKRLLRPSDRVTFATRDRVPVGKKRYKKLGRAAWLYWQDMAPYARFEHPSEMLLLDKKTRESPLTQEADVLPARQRKATRVPALDQGICEQALPGLRAARGACSHSRPLPACDDQPGSAVSARRTRVSITARS